MSMILELRRILALLSGSFHARFRNNLQDISKVSREVSRFFSPVSARGNNKPLPSFFLTRGNPNYPNRIAGLTASHSSKLPPPSPPQRNPPASGNNTERSLAGRSRLSPGKTLSQRGEHRPGETEKDSFIAARGTKRRGWVEESPVICFHREK